MSERVERKRWWADGDKGGWRHGAGLLVCKHPDGFAWYAGVDYSIEDTAEAAMLAAESSALRQALDELRALGYDVSSLEAQRIARAAL